MDMVMDAVGLPLEAAKGLAIDLAPRAPERGAKASGHAYGAPAHAAGGLGRETYASFLLLAVTGFTLAGYLLIALALVGAVK